MARNRAALWTCLLGAALVRAVPPAVPTAAPSSYPGPPLLTACVFQNRANVTCRWEAGDGPVPRYTLQVQKVLKKTDESQRQETYSLLQTFSCTTSDTSCTAGMSGSSVRFTFCVVVTAHTRRGNVSSAPRCQSGRTEVMLPPVNVTSVKPVAGKPGCLSVSWRGTLAVFPVSASEVKNGKLNSQIRFTAQGQLDSQVRNVTVANYSVMVCFFRPDTPYTVRLRHRFQGPRSPWSPWSNAQQGRTAEAAPSAAPAFWRREQPRGENGWRRVSLLWKPLSRLQANGRVRFYNVTCQTGNTGISGDYGSCTALHQDSTSCSLLLPAGRCSCSLTASNSAGTSPEARVWLRGPSDPEPPAPNRITATPLGESRLDVRWADPGDRSATGFVLEWFAVREDTDSVLRWERLNSSCRALVITEGLKPKERYSVSVTGLYGDQGPGSNRTLHVYTVQGAPSAGPALRVQRLSGSTVELSWSPVSVQLRHGFIRNYTLCYSRLNQTAKCVFVPGHAHACSLKALLPGDYAIFMRANTDAGAGAAGPISSVRIDPEELSVVMFTLVPPVAMLLALVLMGCLAQNSMVKQKLCHDVPDPSHSSLAHWAPKAALRGMKHSLVAERSAVKYSQVAFAAEAELQTCTSDPERFDLQSYASLSCSPAPILRSHNPGLLELLASGNPTGAEITSAVYLSSYIYSKVVTPQTLRNASTSSLSPFNEGEEPPQSQSPHYPTDQHKPCSLFLTHQIPGSFPNISTSFLSSSVRPDASPTSLSTLLPPRPLVLVDMSYCPVRCQPHTPLAD